MKQFLLCLLALCVSSDEVERFERRQYHGAILHGNSRVKVIAEAKNEQDSGKPRTIGPPVENLNEFTLDKTAEQFNHVALLVQEDLIPTRTVTITSSAWETFTQSLTDFVIESTDITVSSTITNTITTTENVVLTNVDFTTTVQVETRTTSVPIYTTIDATKEETTTERTDMLMYTETTTKTEIVPSFTFVVETVTATHSNYQYTSITYTTSIEITSIESATETSLTTDYNTVTQTIPTYTIIETKTTSDITTEFTTWTIMSSVTQNTTVTATETIVVIPEETAKYYGLSRYIDHNNLFCWQMTGVLKSNDPPTSYIVSLNPQSYADAKQMCNGFGYHFTTVNSQNVNILNTIASGLPLLFWVATPKNVSSNLKAILRPSTGTVTASQDDGLYPAFCQSPTPKIWLKIA